MYYTFKFIARLLVSTCVCEHIDVFFGGSFSIGMLGCSVVFG